MKKSVVLAEVVTVGSGESLWSDGGFGMVVVAVVCLLFVVYNHRTAALVTAALCY